MVRYALSDCVRRDMPISGISLIPRAEEGDILVPPYNGSEDPAAAVKFLTLWSSWALQLGFSHDLAKQLLEDYIKKAFNLPRPKVTKTWTELVQNYYRRHRISEDAARSFIRWYDESAKSIPIVWFSYRELEIATDGFAAHNWVGQGSAGTVYKGRLGDNSVAVKVLKHSSRIRNVMHEVSLHREITGATHPDVVRLVGFSSYARNPLLVSEFVGGNLRHHLEGVYGDQVKNSPRIRLSIAIDIANGISQLHYAGPWPIFHMDVSSTNVLLDADFRAKLNDLGRAVGIKTEADMRMAASTQCEDQCDDQSQGYVDPVLARTGELHEKTDVFSYGVVLMELVTLKKAWDPARREKSLAALVVTRTRGGTPYSVMGDARGHTIPPGRPEELYGGGVLETMLHVAVWCCDLDLERRPTIAEVADYLQALRRSGSRRRYMADADLVGDQRGRLGWEWDHASPITSPRS